ncbi:DUF4221 family protein [Cecembia calidifontis]|uniref:Uncharacterized protein DUF4221 n=1 Tax=Cecembia calidifontis TaxID=1187080 RepID=A0A4Q7P948_9BACT|nr:DUF4221 family protein [Cecembia calidifontis]RZS96040.1 uncharacterized protein DUF4221 [Cecembia calidifontis]
MEYQKITFSILLIIFSFMFSCKNLSDDFKNETEGFLERVGEITFALDEFSTFEFYNAKIVSVHGKELLANLNYINFSLDFYDVEQGKLFHRIKIGRGGPEGIDDVQGFWFHNQDSIFIFPRFKLHGSTIVNWDGNFVDKLNPPRIPDIPGGILLNHLSTSSTPTFVLDQKIYFMRYPIDNRFIGEDSFESFGILDLKKNLFEFYEFEYPSVYRGKNHIMEFYTFSGDLMNDSSFLLSWTISDSVDVYSVNESGISKIKSFYASIPEFQVPNSNSSFITPEMEKKIKFESFSYGAITFDPFRNQIHRLLYLPTQYEPGRHKKENPYLVTDFLILTYDDKFNHLGTTHFKGGIYDPRVFIVGKKGLFFPRIGQRIRDLKEDEIVYHVFSGTN